MHRRRSLGSLNVPSLPPLPAAWAPRGERRRRCQHGSRSAGAARRTARWSGRRRRNLSATGRDSGHSSRDDGLQRKPSLTHIPLRVAWSWNSSIAGLAVRLPSWSRGYGSTDKLAHSTMATMQIRGSVEQRVARWRLLFSRTSAVGGKSLAAPTTGGYAAGVEYSCSSAAFNELASDDHVT
eukprot:scaffold1906_cov403-Prasinococcus_capsulatus_cf.AAC.1